MAVERINPPELSEPEGFVHVAVGTGQRMISVAGQVARDREGNVVGEGDLAAQTAQALRNVGAALSAASAGFDDVTSARIYVVDWHEDKMEQLVAGAMRAAQEAGTGLVAATTLVPVPRLFEPGYLIEIEVAAVA